MSRGGPPRPAPPARPRPWPWCRPRWARRGRAWEGVGRRVEERGDDHVVAAPELRQQPRQRLLVGGDHRRRLLDVEVQHDAREGLEDLRERGDAEVSITGRSPAEHVVLRRTPSDSVVARAEPVGVVEVAKLVEAERRRSRPWRWSCDRASGRGRRRARRRWWRARRARCRWLRARALAGSRRACWRATPSPPLVGVGDHPPFEPGIVAHASCLPGECACRATGG